MVAKSSFAANELEQNVCRGTAARSRQLGNG
jgi:hypothetical protein